MSILRNLARRWADARLARESRGLQAQLDMARQDRTMFRRNLARVVDANKSLGHINRAYQQMRRQAEADRDEARQHVTDLTAENAALANENRELRASLDGTREQLRQAQAERARAEQDAAELTVTVDGLGLAMRDLEQAAQRRVILPGQRANLDDLGEEKRYFDGQGDE